MMDREIKECVECDNVTLDNDPVGWYEAEGWHCVECNAAIQEQREGIRDYDDEYPMVEGWGTA